MTIATVLTRLKECHAEISGITRVFERQPEMAISASDLPCIWVRPGRMTQAAPATSAGQAIITREYIVTVLVAALEQASTESLNEGDPKMATVEAVIETYINYLLTHPRLATTAESYANHLVGEDVLFMDSGVIAIERGPGGSRFAGFQMTLTIKERRIPSPQQLG